MRCPSQCLWPAFWLLPQDQAYGTWAASGEIDIVEARNPGSIGGNTSYGALHYGGQAPRNVFSGEQYAVATDVTADFHVYALEWDAAEIRWYVDSQQIHSTRDGVPHAPHYLILNSAVGGSWPGNPDATTVFPQFHDIDYARVYQRDEYFGRVDPR